MLKNCLLRKEREPLKFLTPLRDIRVSTVTVDSDASDLAFGLGGDRFFYKKQMNSGIKSRVCLVQSVAHKLLEAFDLL